MAETRVTFDSEYQFCWVKNIGTGDCYISDRPNIQAEAEGVAYLPAGEATLITMTGRDLYIVGDTVVECKAQNFAECPYDGGSGGSDITVESLSVTENGTYTAPSDKAYSPVTVNVPNTYTASDEGKVVLSGALVSQTTRNITENGTYDTTTNNSVVVDVQEQPWTPLEDGYSNFWFELTDDTLSPWLNFSAKNNDATIDWGDGSGEVALDTLTPTHTYSKAGKYVVKVKGVTGIARMQINPASDSRYWTKLIYAELNQEVTYLGGHAFTQYYGLRHVTCKTAIENTQQTPNSQFYSCLSLNKADIIFSSILPQYIFYGCNSIKEFNINEGVTEIGEGSFSTCQMLNKVTIPTTVTYINSYAFQSCASLYEIHVKATTPPSLGQAVFAGLNVNYTIYVPVGTGDTYKAAARWSSYADHIQEEV